MTDRPRIAPVRVEDLDGETRALVETLGRPLNIFTTLAHHPKLLKRWMVFGTHVLAKNSLPAREREIVVLRVGWRCGCEYEFGQHVIIGTEAGLTGDEIRRLTVEDRAGWSPEDAAVVAAADELVARHRISDETWAALAGRWSDEQLLDLIFTAGQYTMVSMFLNSAGVQLDEGVGGFPD